MKAVLSNAYFGADAATVNINGVVVCVDTKHELLAESLCLVTGDRDISKLMNNVSTPQDPEVLACDDPRLVELAARYYLWSNSADADPDAPEPQEILQDEISAGVALRAHQQKLGAMA